MVIQMERHKYRMSKKLVSTIGLKESISRLPEEIQAFILSKLDGNSAAVAKRVCKLWNELLTGTYEPRPLVECVYQKNHFLISQ